MQQDMASFAQIAGAWVAAGLTLAIFSFLYRDNPVYRLAEHVYVGVSMGYLIVRTYFDTIQANLIEPLVEKSEFAPLVAAVLGLMLFTRFSRRASWISRYSFAFLVGIASGMAIPRFMQANVLEQIIGTFREVGQAEMTLGQAVTAFLIVLGVVSVLIYFLFSVRHTGAVGTISKVGICFLMVHFGAAFGYTVMGRISLLIGRCDDLREFGTHRYAYGTFVMAVVIVVLLVLQALLSRRAKKRGKVSPE